MEKNENIALAANPDMNFQYQDLTYDFKYPPRKLEENKQKPNSSRKRDVKPQY